MDLEPLLLAWQLLELSPVEGWVDMAAGRTMSDLLAKAMQGIDFQAPDAGWQLFLRLWGLLPWWQLLWWNLGFVLVGAALGWWRGQFWRGVLWSLLLGPLGWLPLMAPRRRPPPLPPAGRGGGR